MYKEFLLLTKCKTKHRKKKKYIFWHALINTNARLDHDQFELDAREAKNGEKQMKLDACVCII